MVVPLHVAPLHVPPLHGSLDIKPSEATTLHIRVSFGRCEVSAQFLRRAARTVTRSVTLNAPPLPQRARVNCVEAELIEQTG